MKSIISHLKRNWLRYGFETFVVLNGVLGAFALNSWNETRKAGKQELVVVQQLLEEFKYNRIQLDSFLNYIEERKRPALALYQMYGTDPQTVDIQQFDSLVATTLWYKSFQIGQAVLDDVLNSGRLSLIQSDSLRFLLTGWPSVLERSKKEDHYAYDYVEQTFRYTLDHISWRNTDKYEPILKAYMQGNSKLKPDNRSALYSFEFENRMGQLLWYLENVSKEYTILGEHMNRIIMILERELVSQS